MSNNHAALDGWFKNQIVQNNIALSDLIANITFGMYREKYIK